MCVSVQAGVISHHREAGWCETDKQTVTVNDSDAALSVTRIHPVVMLQADRKSLLLWASVTHTHPHIHTSAVELI